MKHFDLTYNVRWKTVQPRAEVWAFGPGEIFPGIQIVVIGEPRNYEGLSVTNGSEMIATAIMRQHGIMPFQTLYVEHYPDEGHEGFLRKPSYDTVYYQWTVVKPGCPVKIAASNPKWSPLPLVLAEVIHHAIYAESLTNP